MQEDYNDDKDHFCRECGIDLDIRNIAKGRYNRKDWICNYCHANLRLVKRRKYYKDTKESRAIKQKEYNKRNQIRIKENFLKFQLKSKYNLGIEDYNKMLKDQNNVCAICKQEESDTHYKTQNKKRLSVDHCHKTKKIRGLLCRRCNTVIGLVNEDLNLLTNIYKYVNIQT